MARIYFTGRRKLARKTISISIIPADPPQFKATVDLSPYQSLPRDARVLLEAYHNTTIQRFDFGTVSDCRLRQDPILSDFSEYDRPRFRLRVVGNDSREGVILAACDRIQPTDDGGGASGGESILPIIWKPDDEMRGELWRVHSSGLPELWINRDVPILRTGLQGGELGALIQGAIIPAAIRQILVCEFEQAGGNGDEIDSEWKRFAETFNSDPIPSNSTELEERDQWIDQVVWRFCRVSGHFVDRINAMSFGEDD